MPALPENLQCAIQIAAAVLFTSIFTFVRYQQLAHRRIFTALPSQHHSSMRLMRVIHQQRNVSSGRQHAFVFNDHHSYQTCKLLKLMLLCLPPTDHAGHWHTRSAAWRRFLLWW